MADYSPYINPKDSIDWQRSNAPLLKAWLEKEKEWYDENHGDFWDSYLTDIFDLRTCNDFGLSVWSIILDESTYGVTEASGPDYPAWGFGANRKNFGNGNFGTNSDTGYNFTTEERRILLRLKAFILHMSGVVSGNGELSINRALSGIFGEGAVYCIDNRDMTFTYIINDPELEALGLELYSRDLLPRPIGISVFVVIKGSTKQWGFGSNRGGFNNSNFNAGIIAGD